MISTKKMARSITIFSQGEEGLKYIKGHFDAVGPHLTAIPFHTAHHVILARRKAQSVIFFFYSKNPFNTVTTLTRPGFCGSLVLVTELTGFHCYLNGLCAYIPHSPQNLFINFFLVSKLLRDRTYVQQPLSQPIRIKGVLSSLLFPRNLEVSTAQPNVFFTSVQSVFNDEWHDGKMSFHKNQYPAAHAVLQSATRKHTH